MEYIQGKIAFGGIAFGKIKEFVSQKQEVYKTYVEDTKAEIDRFERAREEAKHQLQELHRAAIEKVGQDKASIFEVHQMMLEDPDYLDSIYNIIKKQGVNAEFAITITEDDFTQMFAQMTDDYMKARAADIKDVSERLIQILMPGQIQKQDMMPIDQKCIIVADDLSPSETIQLDREKVLAFVTRNGSTNSHTAILARTMNIPALVHTQVTGNIDGKYAIVDGEKGLMIVEPTEEVLDEYRKKKEKEEEQRELLKQLKGKSVVTEDGKEIKLYANIGGVKDAEIALQNDADGIGLFRSEFLYLQRQNYPTEEEQFKAYRTVAEMMTGRQVIIRTMDIGADKKVDYFHLEREDNPALGYRAIRICLTKPEIFRTQLRAILRAAAYGKVAIMLPMITAVWEVREAKRMLKDAQNELCEQGIAYGEVEVGVMIETPAAVMIADELAKEVTFFSIGTNDLTQYTLAVDRQNEQLETFFDAHHPAILKMIEWTVNSAHRAGIWVGICGELGADLELTETFIRMGVDELSVAPSRVLQVKDKILVPKW